jgi:hypothetical protein
LPKALSSNGDPTALSSILNWPDFETRVPRNEAILLLRRAAQTGVASPTQEALLRVPVPAPVALPTPATDADLGQPVDVTVAPLPQPAPPPPIAETWAKTIGQANSAQGRALEARLLIEELRSLVDTAPDQIPPLAMQSLAEAALWAGDVRLAKALEIRSPFPFSPRQRLVLALLDPVAGDRPVERHIEAAINPSAQRQAIRDALIAWSAGMPTSGGLATLIQPGLPDIKGGQAGMRTALSFAGERGSKGEVALLVGLALQGQEPASADAETVAIAVRALRRVGLSTQAIDLAREYMLALDMVAPSRPVAATAPAPQPTATKPSPAQTTPSTGLRANTSVPNQAKAKPPAVAAKPSQAALPPSTRAPAPKAAPKSKAKAPSKPSWTPP